MNEGMINKNGFSCPMPINNYEHILLAHGGGGRLSHSLIQEFFIEQFNNPSLNAQHDGAVFTIDGTKLAFTTDSYVVQPVFFPGGNIGELAVNGTINDLAMCGAKPIYISAGLIIEEGLLMEDLWKIVQSMKKAAESAGVQIVTGDTKVVEHGKGDKIFINTSGIGIIDNNIDISPQRCSVGDNIIINGRIAEHGIAILSARENFEFVTKIQSDTVPLNGLVSDILKASKNIHVLRDPTRGGLSSSLNEIAVSSNTGIIIEENKIPITEEVKGACEILGFDPLYIANEGKMLVFVPPEDTGKVLSAMLAHPLGRESAIVGKVIEENPGIVVMKTSLGSTRIVDMMTGEQLPRIC